MSNSDSIQSLVSVVLCTYNGEKYLQQQIDSILQQTYSPLEIIIVDDASTDSTVTILENYCQVDKRVKCFINPENIGYNKNFEKGFLLASGDYIAICDQDDIWEMNKIERMMKEWPAGSLFIYSLSGNFFTNHFDKRTLAPNVHYSSIDDLYKLVFNSPVHGHASIFKKELLNYCMPFPADIFYDWWMSMHAASIGIIGCVPLTLTWHRVHEKNSSRMLTSISDKEERNRQLREQSVYFIETFCAKGIAKEKEKKYLLEYASLLKRLDGKKFSRGMFTYVMKHRHQVFHYKKKLFVYFSHLKHAYRMARKGLL